MKHGHVKGTKKERKGATDWYAPIQAAHLRRLEAEQAAREVQKQHQQQAAPQRVA